MEDGEDCADITGGWWEKENFDTLIRIVREIAENAN
jgi:hypothetical protein